MMHSSKKKKKRLITVVNGRNRLLHEKVNRCEIPPSAFSTFLDNRSSFFFLFIPLSLFFVRFVCFVCLFLTAFFFLAFFLKRRDMQMINRSSLPYWAETIMKTLKLKSIESDHGNRIWNIYKRERERERETIENIGDRFCEVCFE